ncbi:unnamed protein product [Enterobius vermicularis]|uniref:MFS domain-containing protein n=1 Tax=Enterobius vermicularis TaxID=51028 RepID=A0A0N4V988_ENTVE|nr:unnamed protein product [Enterobius vermicularis]
MFMFGNMFGASALTYASDSQKYLTMLNFRFGRKPIVIFGMISLPFTNTISLLFGVKYLPISRFLQGLFTPALLLVMWVQAYECIPVKLRKHAAFSFGVFWVFGYCVVAPIAYYFPDWILLSTINTAPTAIFALVFIFILPESFHFLVLKNKDDQVRAWINKAKRYNIPKITLSADEIMYETVLRTKKTGQPKQSESDKSWTCDTFVYFGLSLYTTHLAGNVYWNYTLSGLIELPVYILSPWALERFGRKPVVAITHFLAGISLAAFIVIPDGPGWIPTSFWLLGKFSISCSFMSIFVYSSEVFPTSIRNTCIGSCTILARIGGILAPYVRHLRSIVIFLPMLFFGILSVIAGFLTLFLPETRNKHLPSLLDQIDGQKKTEL